MVAVRFLPRLWPFVLVALLLAAACGGDVVVDSGGGAATSTGDTPDAGCALIIAACTAACANPACVARIAGNCLAACEENCSIKGCWSEYYDFYMCEATTADCTPAECVQQNNAAVLCCDAAPDVCTITLPDAGSSPDGG